MGHALLQVLCHYFHMNWATAGAVLAMLLAMLQLLCRAQSFEVAQNGEALLWRVAARKSIAQAVRSGFNRTSYIDEHAAAEITPPCFGGHTGTYSLYYHSSRLNPLLEPFHCFEAYPPFRAEAFLPMAVFMFVYFSWSLPLGVVFRCMRCSPRT